MLSIVHNPKILKGFLNKLPSKMFRLEINIYLMLFFWILFYVMIPPEHLYVNNQPEGYRANLWDYLYFTAINHATIGLGDFTPITTRGKLLKTLHAISIVCFNLVVFD
jgi:hypothetical protein